MSTLTLLNLPINVIRDWNEVFEEPAAGVLAAVLIEVVKVH
jgi:hypothetical protein